MEKCTEKFKNGNTECPAIEDIIDADREAKKFAQSLVRLV